MTWQSRYPEIARGMEIAEKKHFMVKMREKVYPVTTLEEDEVRLKEKKERLRVTHSDVYNRLSKTEEVDWAVLLKPRDPFRS